MFFLVSQFQTQFRLQIVHCIMELGCHFLISCVEINVINISSVGTSVGR